VNKSKLVAFALAAWIALEVVAFVLVVQFLGLLAAIALGVGTTLLGLSDVRRLLVYLRSRVGKPKGKGGGKAGGALLDGGLQALGSLLLILPGFASDLVGLALKAPSIRAGVAGRLRDRDKTRKGPRTIDLAPNEWKNLTHDGRARE
jgi:UPF0716 protein FxsA